jgi:enamine deaminase RidA (YjgF/YER057c/UK114 family)
MALERTVYHRREMEREFGYSEGALAGGLFFLSGIISADDAGGPLHPGDCAAQVREIYRSIGEALASQGLGPDSVVRETIYCVDMDAMGGGMGPRLDFYRDCEPPALTIVQVQRIGYPESLLEVELTAYRGARQGA